MKLYAVKDVKVGFMQVVMFHNNEEAKRAFLYVASDKNSTVGKNPEDYELWYLGNYDVESGLISDTENRSFVCSALRNEG